MLPIPKRIVDLSHAVHPGEEEYRLELDTRPTSDWPQFAQYQCPNNEWYIISEITLNTHVGTHVELPYHHVQTGQDAATYPLDKLVGEACVVDISDWGHNECIDLEGLKKKCAGLLKAGDIAYFYTGFDRFYRTDKQHNRPWFSTDCIHWLADEVGIKVMGVDTSGIEIRNPDGSPSIGQPNHEALLSKDIALVEYLANLGEFLNQRFYAYILPVKVRGAESFPVRAIGVQ